MNFHLVVFMGGIADFWTQLPTPVQLINLCAEAISPVCYFYAHPVCHQYFPYTKHPSHLREAGLQGSAVPEDFEARGR